MSNFPRLSPVSGAKSPLYGTGWDLAVIGGEKVPGHSYITSGGVHLKEDQKKKAGVHGGNPTYHGIDPQKFELVVNVWTDEQIAKLAELCAKWVPSTANEPKGVLVDHPAIRMLRIVASFFITGATILGPSKDFHGRSMTFHLRHRLPEKKPATVSPTKKPPVRSSVNYRAQDAAKRNPKPSTQAATVAPPA